MEVSKLKISQEVLDKNKLNRKQKTTLRKKIVKEYIQSKPFGTPITIKEFSNLLRYKTSQESKPLIDEMLKIGEISREPLDHYKKGFTYVVCGQIRVTNHSSNSLEEVAKDYIWQEDSTTEQIQAIRAFVKYAKGKIK